MELEEIKDTLYLAGVNLEGVVMEKAINLLSVKLPTLTISFRQWNSTPFISSTSIPVSTNDVEKANKIAAVLMPLHNKIFNL